MSTNPLKILLVASEAVPFCKTGGLADVVGALAKELSRLGHEVRLAIPRYADIDSRRFRLLPILPEMKVNYGGQTFTGSVFRCPYPGTDLPVYFVDEPNFFDRPGIYGPGRGDYPDNNIRFAFFNMATLWALKGLDWRPDVIHANDWQTGLIPALLQHHPEVASDPFYQGIRTVFSIHNLAYQGNFDKWTIPNIGLPWSVFTPDGMEFYNQASFLKSGVVFSDALVAVSPTYAKEIQSEEFGAGLAGTLSGRADSLYGILNGIDTEEWNPEGDKEIAEPFSGARMQGKAACKAHLQRRAGLPEKPRVPLVAMVSRLIAGKGFDLITEALPELLALDAQYVVLGNGEPAYEQALVEAAKAHPDRLYIQVGYDISLSHQMIAGADLFLMPSRYEPCGLTQMYSMRYGTVPIVRLTGGLSDSVVDASPASVRDGSATGFQFAPYTAEALVDTVRRAVSVYTQDPAAWARLVQNAMAQNHSWAKSAGEYVELYRGLIES